jgi:Rod binding domain-containing protein
MDISELLLNQGVAGVQVGKVAKASGLGAGADIDVEDEKLKKVARDFESVFIHELLKRMEDTIPESDMEDQSSKQIKGMYWSYMAQAIADRGGFGLWKNIYDAMGATGSEAADSQAVQPILDKSV